MDALWDLEDKWKLSTQEAVLVFACTAFLLIGLLCTATALKRRARQKQLVGQEPNEYESEPMGLSEPPERGMIKKALVGSVRWSKTSKWEERPTPLLRGRELEGEVGWGSHNSDSPVWQRPILMGEKCELPRYSGLILYDERGRPVHESSKGTTHQEIKATDVTTTLRDLL